MATINPTKAKNLMETWVNNPNMSYQEICDECKVGYSTFARWRTDPVFMEEYHKKCDARFSELEAKAVAKVSDLVDDGNWNAIKYVLDNKGYKPEEKSKVTVEGATEINLMINAND